MERDEYQRMYELERTYWWHVGRLHLLRSLFDRWLPRGDRRRILDFGCGTGSALDLLGRHGTVTAVDDSEIALALCRERQAGSRAVRLVRVPEQGPLPFADGSFDLVTALDVLEHLPDDVAGLVRLRTLLAPGGQLVLTVPAYDFLWSGEDVISAHHRRYTRRTLEAVCHAAGLEVLFMSYFNMALLPVMAGVIWARRLLDRDWASRSNVQPVPGWLNRCFETVSAFETRRVGDERLRLPAGASLVCRLRSVA